MTPAAAMIQRAKEIRHRLLYPPNAVKDTEINLKRKLIPEKSEEEPVIENLTLRVSIEEIEAAAKRITFPSILRAVSDYYRIRVMEIMGQCRTKETTTPRHVAMYLAMKHTNLGSEAIGWRFNRDHTTVLAAQWKITELMLIANEIGEDIREIENSLLLSHDYDDSDHAGSALAAVA